MANRDNHYEAAFEGYLRGRQVAYVAVDEARRSLLGDESLKSLDFIVSPSGGGPLSGGVASQGGGWLVDVKGRRFPSGRKKQYWKNWSTRDDLSSLARWERLFGARFGGLFVFAYNIVSDRSPLPAEELFEFRGRLYAFVGVRLEDYARHARQISPRWDTLAMPGPQFRELAAPLSALIGKHLVAPSSGAAVETASMVVATSPAAC